MLSPDDLATAVRAARKDRHLTQAGLARRAGISLATLQNIEAGTANPSVETLRRVLEPLGMEVTLRPREADWDALAHLGLPLTVLDPEAEAPDPRDLPALARSAVLELESGVRGEAMERKREALEALLCALMTHFPTLWRSALATSPGVAAFVPDPPSGRVIKLARIAKARLAEVI